MFFPGPEYSEIDGSCDLTPWLRWRSLQRCPDCQTPS